MKQAKIRSYKTAPKYKFGHRVPNDYQEAMRFDMENNNERWKQATKLEMQQLMDYDSFKDAGIYGKDPLPEGYLQEDQRIPGV